MADDMDFGSQVARGIEKGFSLVGPYRMREEELARIREKDIFERNVQIENLMQARKDAAANDEFRKRQLEQMDLTMKLALKDDKRKDTKAALDKAEHDFRMAVGEEEFKQKQHDWQMSRKAYENRIEFLGDIRTAAGDNPDLKALITAIEADPNISTIEAWRAFQMEHRLQADKEMVKQAQSDEFRDMFTEKGLTAMQHAVNTRTPISHELLLGSFDNTKMRLDEGVLQAGLSALTEVRDENGMPLPAPAIAAYMEELFTQTRSKGRRTIIGGEDAQKQPTPNLLDLEPPPADAAQVTPRERGGVAFDSTPMDNMPDPMDAALSAASDPNALAGLIRGEGMTELDRDIALRIYDDMQTDKTGWARQAAGLLTADRMASKEAVYWRERNPQQKVDGLQGLAILISDQVADEHKQELVRSGFVDHDQAQAALRIQSMIRRGEAAGFEPELEAKIQKMVHDRLFGDPKKAPKIEDLEKFMKKQAAAVRFNPKSNDFPVEFPTTQVGDDAWKSLSQGVRKGARALVPQG